MLSRKRVPVAPLVAALALTLSMPAAAQSRVNIATPSLVPGYSESITDFTVKCSAPVEFSVTAGQGEKVSIDRRPFKEGSFVETVSLSPGQGLKLRVRSDGKYRSQPVRCLPDDFPLWNTKKRGRPQAQWYITVPNFRLAPARKLPAFGSPYIAVADRRGVPVWWFREPGSAPPMDAKLAPGNRVSWGTFRDGYPYVTRRLDGTVSGSVTTPLGVTNYHDMQRTRDGGYLMIGDALRGCFTEPSRCVDLSPWGGPARAEVIDNVVQRLDRRGRLLWSWSTRDNIDVAEGASWINHPSLGPRDYGPGLEAYDIFHVNSVAEAGSGAVISVRHADALYRIPGHGRGVRWKLGGTKTAASLPVKGLPGGAKAMSGQHDARVLRDGTVTVLDNGSFQNRGPRALRFRIGATRATLMESVPDSRASFSVGVGSARKLAGGNWAVSWGAGSSLFSEVTPGGRPVLSMTYPGGLFSYRVDAIEPGRLKAADLRAGMDAQYPR